MFIKTFSESDWPKDLSFTNCLIGEVAFDDDHWQYMNQFPEYINSDTITCLLYEHEDWYYEVDEKYKNYYFVLALVTWSKMPVILSMHETEKEAQEELRLLALEINK